jgi:small subunit ribosomal protein S19
MSASGKLKKRLKKKTIKVWDRSSKITLDDVGLNFQVHQGVRFIKLVVGEEMVGFRFGEFAPTRIRHEYKKKRLKQKK